MLQKQDNLKSYRHHQPHPFAGCALQLILALAMHSLIAVIVRTTVRTNSHTMLDGHSGRLAISLFAPSWRTSFPSSSPRAPPPMCSILYRQGGGD